MFPEEQFEKKFSAWSYIFISLHGFAENILTLRKTPWSSRRHFTWPVESFEEECLGKTKNSWVLWTERKFSVSWRNSFSRVVKIAFRVSRETFWEKCICSRKKYDFESIFWHWVKNFDIGRNNLRKMKFFSKKIWLWIHFLTLDEKLPFLA